MRNKNLTKFVDFNLFGFFDKYGLDYSEQGTNIGRDYVGISPCPFCDATNNHFGINKYSKSGKCFVCGKTATLPLFIKSHLRCSWNEAYKIIGEFTDGVSEIIFRESSDKVTFPSKIVTELPKMAKTYLLRRNFNPEYLHEQYKLSYTLGASVLKMGNDKSNFMYRIIIPIVMNNKLVSYLGRDYTEERSPKYMQPLLDACIIPPSSAIYNYDYLKKGDNCVIVEGVTDMWRLGGRTVSVNGKVVTKEQIKFIAEKQLNKVVILFDENADDEAEKLANNLTGVVNEIHVAYLDGGDPGELSPEDAIRIREQLLN